MALIRRRHHEDIREVVATAETVAGWGRSARPYAWAALGAAAATAFWLVIKRGGRPPASQATLSDASEVHEGIAKRLARDSERSRPRPRFRDDVWDFLISVAVRAAQGYAAHCLEQWMAQQRMMAAIRHGPSQQATRCTAVFDGQQRMMAATRHGPPAPAGALERLKGRSARPERES
jgi:hypothetical protein